MQPMNLWRNDLISPALAQRGGHDFLINTYGPFVPEGEGKVPETTGGTRRVDRVPPLFLAKYIGLCLNAD